MEDIQANIISPLLSQQPFNLTHDESLMRDDPCEVRGQFSIEVRPLLGCVNPQFSIRMWHKNLVTNLKPWKNMSLQVPYELYRSEEDGPVLTVTIEVVMLYCYFNKSSVKDNVLQLQMIKQPQYLALNISRREDTRDSNCPPPPHHWKFRNSSSGDMNILKGIRTEMSMKHFTSERHTLDAFEYSDKSAPCSIPPNGTLCVVGASHARVLQVLLHEHWGEHKCGDRAFMNVLFQKKRKCNSNRIHYIESKYLKDFHKVNFNLCDDVIITYGQWDLALDLYNNYIEQRELIQSIDTAYRDLVKNLTQGLSKLNDTQRVYLLSMNYTPLSHGHCTHFNASLHNTATSIHNRYFTIRYNTPPFVDEFNAILSSEVEMLENNSKVSFLDMRNILEPMWDSAKDHNHFINKVGSVMANTIVCKLF